MTNYFDRKRRLLSKTRINPSKIQEQCAHIYSTTIHIHSISIAWTKDDDQARQKNTLTPANPTQRYGRWRDTRHEVKQGAHDLPYEGAASCERQQCGSSIASDAGRRAAWPPLPPWIDHESREKENRDSERSGEELEWKSTAFQAPMHKHNRQSLPVVGGTFCDN